MTAVEEPVTTFVRPDGREKVTGAGRYTADLTLTGQLHAAFRYADHPHARITRIDTAKARALPGVIAVVTHEDVPGRAATAGWCRTDGCSHATPSASRATSWPASPP